MKNHNAKTLAKVLVSDLVELDTNSSLNVVDLYARYTEKHVALSNTTGMPPGCENLLDPVTFCKMLTGLGDVFVYCQSFEEGYTTKVYIPSSQISLDSLESAGDEIRVDGLRLI